MQNSICSEGLLLKKKNTFRNDFLICPYCFYEDEDTYEHDVVYEQSDSEVECVNCEKTFKVETEWLFTTSKKEPQ